MSITVREALHLGGLRRGRVVAGSAGLDRPITWVKVLESPETLDWLAEGELVLTVAFAIKDDRAAQADLMRGLAGVKSSGLVTLKNGSELDSVLTNITGLVVARVGVDLLTAGSDHYPITATFWSGTLSASSIAP